MKFKLLLLTAFFILSFSNAQEKMTIGSKQYPSTAVFEFFCENYKYDPLLDIQFAKTANGGIMKLVLDVSNNQLYIGGRIYIILSNGNIIYCTDKGTREYKNGQSIAYYSLLPAEMSLVKKFTIENIRFRIMGKTSEFSSGTGYFTASNKKQLLNPMDNSTNKIDTKDILKAI